MDIFVEQIVTRLPDARTRMLKTSLIAAMAAVSATLAAAAYMFAGLPFIAITAAAAVPGVIWLGVQMVKGLSVEYEYILTNKELDIDKITGRRNRNRMVTLDLANAVSFAPVELEELEPRADVTVYAHDNTYINMWQLRAKHHLHGDTVLLFNPNSGFTEKLNKVLPPRARARNIT